ncbi:MAG: lysophospholipase [Actinobacteria bacterium]|nr:lysophospholipase [Actinomycetota bacterium]MBU2687700.1 lysophospholipase [Actinomycetota bacterium]
MKVKRAFAALALLALAIAALVRRAAARLRAPDRVALYPHFEPADFTPELKEARTADGLTLRLKRYPNPGATPLILMHGFSGNCYNYDLAFEEYNFALYLARRGYDVWIANFRGCGREPYKSDGGDFSHSIEDVTLLDVPAIVETVSSETGRKPVWIGHSMGAVAAYGYLQGVTRVEEDGIRRLACDGATCEERHGSLAALVSIAGPVAFHWPYDSRMYWVAGNPAARMALRLARPLLGALGRVAPQMPVERSTVALVKVAPRLGPALLKQTLRFFINMDNMTEETFRETVLSGSSDVSATETLQMVDAMINRDFTEMAAAGPHVGRPHNFTEGVSEIHLPVLFVAGDLDPVNFKVLHEKGHEVVSSEVKEYRCFPDFSHIDLLVGREAPHTVYPFVADWLDNTIGV